MRLKLHETDIMLPSDLDIDERKELVKNILIKYQNNFIYKNYEHVDRKVEVRLEILANYILRGQKQKEKEYLTHYKNTKNKKSEKLFSELSEYGRSLLCLK